MHYSTHALLNCVALLSLLCDADAGKVPPPSEVLSHFARTVGTVLSPTLSAELQRPNRSTAHQESTITTRRQVSSQDAGANSANAAERGTGPVNGIGNLPFPGQGYPYQYQRSYSYRYPPFNQQLSQNFFPGGSGFNNQLLPNGLPFDPRFFQSQLNRNPQLAINQQGGVSKGVNAKLTAAISDGNVKDNGNNNVNTLQNLESNGDSKSSAQQNRPYDNSDFSSIPINPGQGGANLGSLDPSGGNLRVDNRFSAIDYERIRQNYYSDPPINQRYYSSFNDVPFNAGPPYRSPLSDRFANSDFNGGAGGAGGVGAGRGDGGASSGLRAGNGLGNPYFGNFFQGPYQSLNYNNLPGGGNGGGLGGSPNNDGAAFGPEGFDRGSQNFRSPFGLQYPGGFGGPGGGVNFEGAGGGGNFGGPGGDSGFGGPSGDGGNAGIGGLGGDSSFIPGGGFRGEGDSSLRASSAKQSVARPTAASESSDENRASLEELDDRDERERIDREQKVRFVDENEKRTNSEEKRSTSHD